MERINLSVDQCIELVKSEDNINLPVWFQVVSSSMYPWIRANKDKSMLVPINSVELKIGDIVLFPVNSSRGDYCLHRIYKMDEERVQTMGDANKVPDGWIDKMSILGKAVMIQRGNLSIDCEAPKWVRRFRLWNQFWRIRPFMLRLVRIMGKCKRIFKMIINKQT